MSLGWLLDTNVVSEPSRPRSDTQVETWLRSQPAATTYPSVITTGELRRDIELLIEGRRRLSLEQWFQNDLLVGADGRILPVTQTIADRWSVITAERLRSGSPLSAADGLIAATALEHDLVLVTRNTKDFVGLGLALLNPWDDPPRVM